MRGGRGVATALGLITLVTSGVVLRIGAVDPVEPSRSAIAAASGRVPNAVTQTWVCPVGAGASGRRHELLISNPTSEAVAATVSGLTTRTLSTAPAVTVDLDEPTAAPDETSAPEESTTTTDTSTTTTQAPMAAVPPDSLDIGPMSTVVLDTADLDLDGSAVVRAVGGAIAVEHRVTDKEGVDQAPCSTTHLDHWFVAEATTQRNTSLRVWLANAGATDALVAMTFATSDGVRNPESFSSIGVPAGSATVVDVGAVVQRQDSIAFSIVAESGDVVAEAVQVDSGDSERTAGVRLIEPSAGLANRWIVPYGSTAEGVAETVAVFNPTERRADLEVRVRGSGVTEELASEPFAVSLAPLSTTRLELGGESRVAPGLAHFVDVRSPDTPVAVSVVQRISATEHDDDEEAKDFGDRPTVASGWYGTQGSFVASTGWILLGAAARSEAGAETAVGVYNPGDSEVEVGLVAFVDGVERPAVAETVVIPADDMRAVVVDLPAGSVGAVQIVATAPVVVGRRTSMTDPVDVSGALAIASLGEQVTALRVDR